MTKHAPIASTGSRSTVIAIAWVLFIAVAPDEVLGQSPPLLQAGNQVPNNYQAGPNNGAPQFQSYRPQSPTVGQPNARFAANTLPNGQAPVANVPVSNAATGTADPSKDNKIPVRNLLQIFHDGGLMMYPIALCSFVLTVFAFERFIHLRTGRVIPRPFVKRLIEQLQQQQVDREEALELCERNPSPIAAILSAAVKKYGRPSVEVEQAVLDAGEREGNLLRRNMRLLNAISNVSPLLGLLGTVLGMIQAFNDIAGAKSMGRPDLLAGGISQALLTTAAGLLVAIPAYLLYMFFLGRTDKLIMEMDLHAQRLVEAISAEGLQENDTSRTRSRARKAA